MINNYIGCVDHDECVTGVDACEQICHNSNSSYFCSCLSGYRLADNGKTCDGKCISNVKNSYTYVI